MEHVKVPKKEYMRLKRQAEAFRLVAANFFSFATRDSIVDVVDDFRSTGLYSREFLVDLGTGLRKSSYKTWYGSEAAPKRSRSRARKA